MKVAIIGSRTLIVLDFEKHIPNNTTEIVSGGAKGIDSCAAEYARTHGLKLTEFMPNYNLYGRAAPLRRNDEIISYADEVIAFWDGKSKGTQYVIEKCHYQNKPIKIIIV